MNKHTQKKGQDRKEKESKVRRRKEMRVRLGELKKGEKGLEN